MQEHQGEEPLRLRLVQQSHNQPPKAHRLCAKVGPHQRLDIGGGIAFVEDEIDHLKHRFEPCRKLVSHWRLIGDLRLPDCNARLSATRIAPPPSWLKRTRMLRGL